MQLKLLITLEKTELLEPVLRNHYLRALKQLETKTSGAVIALEDVSKRNLNHSGSKFPLDTKVVFIKRELQLLIGELEEWQRQFDPSWYLIALIYRPEVDDQLRALRATPQSPANKLLQLREALDTGLNSSDSSMKDDVFQTSDVLQNERRKIPYTNTYLSRYRDDNREVILDQTNYPEEAVAIALRAKIRALALVLRNAEPFKFGLLKCEGVIEVSVDHKPQYEFVLEVPRGLHTAKTLRSLILEEPPCSLTKRFQLAKQLARSVMFVHTIERVYKVIRPETVLVFSQDDESIGPAFLTGFEKIRRPDDSYKLPGDLDWERNLYRHPTRQELWPDTWFSGHYNIYSLGVCLLEIGLWRSFVEIHGASKTPWAGMGIEEAIADEDVQRGWHAIKSQLLAMAKQRLPSLVGNRYTNVVIACLSCLDSAEDNVFTDDKGIVNGNWVSIGVLFLENVSTPRGFHIDMKKDRSFNLPGSL